MNRKIETLADLQQLIDDQVPEDKYLDYKQISPATGDPATEFLADFSSFANANGGHLIIGVTERQVNGNNTGEPETLTGLPGVNPDTEIQRLENIIRDGIEPRIQGHNIYPIWLNEAKDNAVLVVKVPNSWNRPHVVTYGRRWRFYSRNSNGKYPLNVLELRFAFRQADRAVQDIAAFRMDRLAKIVANETPVPMKPGPQIVLHFVPFASFDTREAYDFSSIYKNQPMPTWTGTSSSRINLDGYLFYSKDTKGYDAYIQLFRNGCIEEVDTIMLSRGNHIPVYPFEEGLIKACNKYMKLLDDNGIELPVAVFLSLLGVRDYVVSADLSHRYGRDIAPIDRDDLFLPEIVVTEPGQSGEVIMKPLIDMIWNAAGWPQAPTFNEQGKWDPER